MIKKYVKKIVDKYIDKNMKNFENTNADFLKYMDVAKFKQKQMAINIQKLNNNQPMSQYEVGQVVKEYTKPLFESTDKYLSEKLKIMQEKLYIMEEQMVINIKEFTEGKSMKMSQSEVERVVKEYVEKIEKENEDRKLMSDIIDENFHQFLEEESKKLKTKELSQDTTLEIIEILENKIKVLEGKVTLLESQQKEEFLDKFAYKTDIAYLDSKINLKSDKGSFINFTDGGIVTLVKDENSESQITQTKGEITIDIKGGVIDIKDSKSGKMAKFIGEDGSMGLKNGNIYRYESEIQGCLWMIVGEKTIPYSGIEELLENWELL